MPCPEFTYPLIRLQQTESTNRYLQDLSSRQEVEEFTAVVAEYQTAGRGQRGNIWEAEAHKNLLFSILLRPHFLEAGRQFLLSQAVSLAIYRSLESLVPKLSIKWPNDIYADNRKIAGILIENELMGSTICHSIVGVGLNVNQQQFTGQAPNPISICHFTHREENRLALLYNIVSHLVSTYETLRQGLSAQLEADYARALFRKQGFHRFRDLTGAFTARIDRVTSDGQLHLVDEQGLCRAYRFKEVEFLP